MTRKKVSRQPDATRRKLVEAALGLMLRKGFNGTSVEDVCKEAGVTKGSFFHHFDSKEAIGTAAVAAWGEFGFALYAVAWKKPAGPLEEIHRLFDIMAGFTRRPEPCMCMVGMMSQEMCLENEAFRAACVKELDTWTGMMRSRLAAAKKQLKPKSGFDPAAVAWFLNSLWQGSMLVGKARQSPAMIRANLKLARAWVDALLTR